MDLLIVSGIIIIVLALFVGGTVLFKKLSPSIEEGIDKVQEMDKFGVLDNLGQMAVELIDERFKGADGYDKFEQAVEWVTGRIEQLTGMEDIDEEMVRGAIQKGYNIYKGVSGNDPVGIIEDYMDGDDEEIDDDEVIAVEDEGMVDPEVEEK